MKTTPIIDKARELIRTHGEIKENVQARDDQWRQMLVQQRRKMAVLVGETGALLAEGLANPSAPPQLREVQEALSELRSRLAHHQASWPAVSLDKATEEYLKSVHQVRAAFTIFESRIDELEQSFRALNQGD